VPASSISRRRRRAFRQAEKIAEKAGDSYVTVERLLLALALEKDSEAGRSWRRGVTPQNLNAAIESCARAAPPIQRVGRERL
jgi:ATP-dependent Clp protease ATP-binding subunit ClpB